MDAAATGRRTRLSGSAQNAICLAALPPAPATVSLAAAALLLDSALPGQDYEQDLEVLLRDLEETIDAAAAPVRAALQNGIARLCRQNRLAPDLQPDPALLRSRLPETVIQDLMELAGNMDRGTIAETVESAKGKRFACCESALHTLVNSPRGKLA